MMPSKHIYCCIMHNIVREYGLPCIIGVEGASKLFKTGDIVALDSESGVISKIE